jgi:phosphatidyl-myo-inositol alpha-mannosyltransferase
MRIGLVCPYDWSAPGGVKQHISDLAVSLIELGHYVNVLTPATNEENLPSWVTSAGTAIGLPYNGSVARIKFDPPAFSRTRAWIKKNKFDILHLHEPTSPSPSIIAAWSARGPIVATHHTSNERSYAAKNMQFALQPMMEKIAARIAVSEDAKRTMINHFGGDAVIIPNGVRVSDFTKFPAKAIDSGPFRILFLGRIDESRKGLSVLLAALEKVIEKFPDLICEIVGPGEVDEINPKISANLVFKGMLSSIEKARAYTSSDVYVAPNLGGESFGIVLLEAMSAGCPVLASDLSAFKRVLNDGEAGALFETANAESLANELISLLQDPEKRRALRNSGFQRAKEFDWSHIVRQILDVYASVSQVDGGQVREDFRGQLIGRITRSGRSDRRQVLSEIIN